MAFSKRLFLPITAGWGIPQSELHIHFVRSGGPGGQNVNKVSTKAVLSWAVTANRTVPSSVRQRFLARYRNLVSQDGRLVISSQRYRSAQQNANDCLAKLRVMLLAVAAEPKRRIPTKPSPASKRRRVEYKQRHARKKRLRRPPADDA